MFPLICIIIPNGGGGQWGKAWECDQRGIDVDILAEEFCQSLMSDYRKGNSLRNTQLRHNIPLGYRPSGCAHGAQLSFLKCSSSVEQIRSGFR